MSTDDVTARWKALRERSPATAPADLHAAPVLDNWEVEPFWGGEGIHLSGVVSTGHPKIAAGNNVTTTALVEVDGDLDHLPARWVRTANTIYALGYPRTIVSPLVDVATQPDWRSAARHALDLTGEWTLSEKLVRALHRLEDGADMERCRSIAAIAAHELEGRERWPLRDAWTLLYADPRSRVDAKTIRDMLVDEAGGAELGKFVRVRNAWGFWTDSRMLPGPDVDHIAAAHALDPSADETARAGFAHVACAINFNIAWERAQRVLPAEIVDELKRRDIEHANSTDRGAVIRTYLAARNGNGPDQDLLALLGTRTDGHHLTWIVDRLSRIDTDEARVAMTVWRAFLRHVDAGGSARFAGDPFSSARHAYARVDPAADLDAEIDGAQGVVVLREIGGTTETTGGKEAHREFSSILGQRLRLTTVPAIAPVRRRLSDEFPHLQREIAVLLSGLHEDQPVRWRPTLLVGEPGGGKSRLARRLAEELGVYLRKFEGASSSDNAFGGTPRRWSTGEHSVPLDAVRRSRTANPWVLIDEIDKAGASRHNGALVDALVTFLEPENARATNDPYLQSDVDLTHVGYVLTANDETRLPAPLRDRLRIVRLPQPSIEDLPALARTVMADIAREYQFGPEFLAPLDDGELAIAESLWPKGGSVRRLTAIVRAIVDHRDRKPRN